MSLRSYIIIFVSLFTINLSAQDSSEANRILDRFSQNALKAPSVSMKFIMVTVDQAENTKDSIAGSVIICKDKYKLDTGDNVTWFNSETSWSYLTVEKEVTITKPSKKDNSFQNKPSSVFTMYKTGYKNRLIEETDNNYIVDLYPEDIKNDLIRVRLSIGKIQMNLKSLEYKRRDGITITLYVKEFNLKEQPVADDFIFHPEKYKGVEIVDMR
jgi:hypothetical protein